MMILLRYVDILWFTAVRPKTHLDVKSQTFYEPTNLVLVDHLLEGSWNYQFKTWCCVFHFRRAVVCVCGCWLSKITWITQILIQFPFKCWAHGKLDRSCCQLKKSCFHNYHIFTVGPPHPVSFCPFLPPFPSTIYSYLSHSPHHGQIHPAPGKTFSNIKVTCS